MFVFPLLVSADHFLRSPASGLASLPVRVDPDSAGGLVFAHPDSPKVFEGSEHPQVAVAWSLLGDSSLAHCLSSSEQLGAS